jgi:hypothetical protein
MARPRTICPDPNEMIKLGEEMLAWVSDKKNNCLHISQWWSGEKFIVENVWETMSVAAEFLPYYNKALRIIGIQYLDKNSRVRDGISQRWQRTYFKDLKKNEDQDLDEAAKRSTLSEKSHDEAALAAVKAVMAMMKEQQIAANPSLQAPLEDIEVIDSRSD